MITAAATQELHTVAVDHAVSARGLTKRYGSITAVDGIDLDVIAGETFGFLGPNGAGKSTTIGMLCTLPAPTSGAASVAGVDVVRQRDDVRRSIGLGFRDTTLDGYLSAAHNLRFYAELYSIDRPLKPERLQRVL